MKSRTRILGIAVIAAVVALALVGCRNSTDIPEPPEPALTGIEVTTPPDKIEYAIGEPFAPTGMVVTATYSDGSTEVIPPDELTVTDPVEENVRLGSRLVTIAYRGMETTLLVAVDDTVAVAGGTFELGRNFGVGAGTPSNPHMTPVSNVTLTTFRMARHLVTQDEWRAVMTGNTNDISVSPSRFSSDPAAGETQGRRPVEEVSWYDVIVYANRLSISAGLTPAYEMQTAADASIWSTDTGTWGNVPTSSDPRWDAVRMVTGSTGYRLPTEAQWEFAAKGGNDPGDYAFSGSDNPFEVAWGSANSASMTREVGRLLPNTLGIYDMSGNVWEWVWDWWDDYTSDDKTDPTGASSGSARVLRGGSWSSSPASTRSVDRRNIAPSNLYGNVGFRLARPQV